MPDSQAFLRDKKLWTDFLPVAERSIAVGRQDKAARGRCRFGLVQRARRVKMPDRHLKQSNPTTWRLAAMNMAIRGIDFNFGKEPANSFTSDQHHDLRADYVMANPPFNISEWWDAKLEVFEAF